MNINNKLSYLSVLNTDVLNSNNNSSNSSYSLFSNVNTIPIVKSPQVVPIKFTLDDIMVESEELKSFECAVCFTFIVNDIKKIEIYQCLLGCYSVCTECWKKTFEGKKQCPLCRKPVLSFKNLSRNRYLEKHLQEIVLVNCPHSLININKVALDLPIEYNINNNNNNIVCDQITSIDKLKQHLKECQYQVLLCDCGIRLLRKDLKIHLEEDCELLKTVCQYCKMSGIYKASINDHYKNCGIYLLKSNFPHHDINSGDSSKNSNYLLLLEKYNELEEKFKQINHYSVGSVLSKTESLSTNLSEIPLIQSTASYSNEWSIEQFSQISRYRHKDFVKSNQFTINNNLSFQICLYPYGWSGSEGWLSLYLLLTNSDKNINLTFSITIPNYLISTKRVSKSMDLEYVGSGKLGWNRLISSKVMVNSDEGYINNDKLLIKFNIKINKVSSIIKKK